MNEETIQITSVQVHFTWTWNMGDYSNIKPGVTLTASVEDGQDPAEIAAALGRMARTFVAGQIDETLEAEGRRPYFYQGPRFTVAVHPKDKLAALLPSELVSNLHGAWDWKVHESRPAVARQHYSGLDGYTGFDCSDGDLSRLPALANYLVFQVTEGAAKIIVLTSADNQDFPESWRDQRHYYTREGGRVHANLVGELKAAAQAEGGRFIDASADSTLIPPLTGNLVVPDPVYGEYEDEEDDDDWPEEHREF